MSVADDCTASVVLSDYMAVDPAGKLTMVGAAFQIAPLGEGGFTAPQFVAAIAEVPSRYMGGQVSLTLELRDVDADIAVQMPTPTGATEALRVQQLREINQPQLPGVYLPSGTVTSRQLMVVGFPAGLPLTPGRAYAWRLEVDGNTRPDWTAKFYVPGAQPVPVG